VSHEDPAPREPPATAVAPAREGPGTKIGPYKLLQLIGEGGFGSVFMAEQTAPVQRTVAFKIIKLGMDTRQVVARFEQERQALAVMDHPNIARVFDAGATDTGRPFFVMEMVKGEPIAEYCDKNNLDIRSRLELFAQVCSAVQHAHTKGIIHRDIKPSNILVSTLDGRPATKVIDFGIAKATNSRLTEKTLFTEHRQLIGTPEYMSPEQAEGSLDIDTRTDVYSLGVLLYELLTGTTPFKIGDLRSAAYAEIQRVIREVDPPRPSTRLSQNTDDIASIAARRHTEPRKLGMLLRGELDWIVMRALEKDRQRRYETANGLAMDVRRYLAGEPVLAAPPGSGYLLRKFIARNRTPVLAAGAVAAALLIGAVGFAWQAYRAEVQRDAAVVAQHSEAAQRRIAEEEKASAETQRNRAVAAEAEAKSRAVELQKVVDFQGKMLAQVDPTSAGVKLSEDVRARFDAELAKAKVSEDQRRAQIDAFTAQWSRVNTTDTALELIDQTILRPAVAAIDTQFVEQPAVAATLRAVLAERYHDLGLDEPALALAQRALLDRRRVLGDDHPDTIGAIGDVGVYLGALARYDEAEVYERDALDRSRRVLGEDHPATIARLSNLGETYLNKGMLREAEPCFRGTLDKYRSLLGDDHPHTIGALSAWGTFLHEQGKLAEAEVCLREALGKRRVIVGEDKLETLQTANSLGAVLQAEEKLDEAIAVFRDVVERKRRVLGATHPSTLRSVQALGATLDIGGKRDEARALLEESLDAQRRLLGVDHFSTLVALGNFGVYLMNQNRLTEAESVCRETLERRRRILGDSHPATLIATNVLGLVLVRQDKRAEAEPYWRDAYAIAQRTLGPAHQDTIVYAQNLAGLLQDQEKFADAEKLLRELLRAGTPTLGAAHSTLLNATRRLGEVLLAQNKNAEAAEVLGTAESDARKVLAGAQDRYLGAFLLQLGRARQRVGLSAGAEPALLDAHQILTKSRGPTHAATRDCTATLASFYEAWDKSEPGKGHDTQAAEWKAKLDAIDAATRAKPDAKR
jgi:tetratricopeptide (TPR) repeat protein